MKRVRIKKWLSQLEVDALNKHHDFSKGCVWFWLNTKELCELKGICRVYSGGDTGRLVGYALAV